MSKKCTLLWREAHFQVKMYRTHHVRTTFGSWDVEKVHAVVARSTFPSQNVQSTWGSDHFWKLRCRKSARRCGAEHISKSKSSKHFGFGPLLEVEMSKKCTPLWRGAHFQVKMYRTHHVRTTFGSWDVEKVHAVVARSTFPSQNVQSTWVSDHFWKLRCRKSARRCGAEHISKSKCTKHFGFGPLLEVEMSKKVHAVVARGTFASEKAEDTSRSDHFWKLRCRKSARSCGAKHISKWNVQTLGVRTTVGGSDVEKVHAVVARSTFRSEHVQSTIVRKCSDHFWKFRCRFALLHYTTLHDTTRHYTPIHYTTLHYTTLHSTTLQLQLQLHNYTPLHSTTLHYTKLHYTTLHYTTLHSTTLHYTTLHYTTFHYTSLHYTSLHSTPLHYNYNYNYTPRHSTTLHSTTLHETTLHSTTLHYITLHYLPLHFTTLHYTTLHYTTTTTTQLHSTTLHYTTLHYTTLQLQLQLHNYTTTQLHSTTLNYSTPHYITLHYITFHYTPLHYTTLHYTTLHWMTLHHR